MRKFLKAYPKILHPLIRDVVNSAEKFGEQIRQAERTRFKAASFLPALEETISRVTAETLAEGGVLSGQENLVFNLAKLGIPGARHWTEVGQQDWTKHLTHELEYRHNYRYADGHGPREFDTPELWNSWFRLPPWLARVVGEKWANAEPEALDSLKVAIVELAEEVADEMGWNVVAVAAHRETNWDFHLHIILTPSIEVEIPREFSKRAEAAFISKIADELFVERKNQTKGSKVKKFDVLREVREKYAKDGFGTIHKLMRRKWRRHSRMLGPSFLGKYFLWQASGRDADLAAFGDRAAIDSKSFRAVVSERIDRGEDLGKTYIDMWASRRFCEKIEAMLTQGELDRARELSLESVGRYREGKEEMPSLEQFIVQEINRISRDLPEEIRRALTTREEAVEKREKEISRTETSLASGMDEMSLKILEGLPPRYRINNGKKQAPHDILKRLVNESGLLAKVREFCRTLKLPTTLKECTKIIDELGKIVGIKKEKDLEME